MSSLDMDAIGAMPGGFAAAPESDLIPIIADESSIRTPTAQAYRYSRSYPVVKRLLDLILASVLLVVTLPLVAIIAIAVKRSSPGDIIFRQTRVGRHGTLFTCYKFRTMLPDGDLLLTRDPELMAKYVASWKLDEDPRVTRVGKFLRKTSLDELPQLVNVLKGEMSLVGPRPYMPHELFGEFGTHAAHITSVRPGITGLWQVSGRSRLTPQQRIELDRQYADTYRLGSDVRIMVKTLAVVVLTRGAF